MNLFIDASFSGSAIQMAKEWSQKNSISQMLVMADKPDHIGEILSHKVNLTMFYLQLDIHTSCSHDEECQVGLWMN